MAESPEPVSDLDILLRTLQPVLNPGVYVYCCPPPGTDWSALPWVAAFQEREGLTLVLPENAAQKAGLPALFRAAWITLEVHSDLQAVGLTGAFASALGAAGISCNVMAAARHDHLFVPVEEAPRALEALAALQRRALAGLPPGSSLA